MMTRARRDTSPAWPVYVPREGLDRVPVFHAGGEWRRAGDIDEHLTRCGQVVYRYNAVTGITVRERTRLRLDHAEAIGTPCQRCWPPEAA